MRLTGRERTTTTRLLLVAVGERPRPHVGRGRFCICCYSRQTVGKLFTTLKPSHMRNVDAILMASENALQAVTPLSNKRHAAAALACALGRLCGVAGVNVADALLLADLVMQRAHPDCEDL